MSNKVSSLCQAVGVPHHDRPTDRREFLARAGGGFGAIALSGMLASSVNAKRFVAAPDGHHPATAKSVIFLFMEGGPSQLDTFDRKPLLNQLAGQPLPNTFREPLTAMGEKNAPLLPTKRKWSRHGESGLEISDWFPNVAKHADELAVIRSCFGEGINHSGGCNLMNTGSTLGGRPSLGAWVSYGLGTENEDLPAFVVMKDKRSGYQRCQKLGTGVSTGEYQGTTVGDTASGEAIANLELPKEWIRNAKCKNWI